MPPNTLRVHTEHVLDKSVGPKVLWAESRVQGTGEYIPPLQTHGKIVEVEIGGVAIYRPFGEFHRANSYCHLYGAQAPLHGESSLASELESVTRHRQSRARDHDHQVTMVTERVNKRGNASHIKTTRGLLVTDLIILNNGQVTRTTSELAPPSPNYYTNGRTFKLSTDLRSIAPLHDGSSEALGSNLRHTCQESVTLITSLPWQRKNQRK
ncbi:uncharacterized protein TNCV_3758031 [Trichonephila clavipes]|nr:uncharacterized protein TNCV_3758031 [Trichonephila clavipes]